MEQSKFYQIKNVTEHEYTLVGCDDSVITRPIRDIDKTATAFTIQDAKDGDVLADNVGVILFKSIGDNNVINFHAYFSGLFAVQEGEHYWGHVRECTLSPATKEQRERFFAKMHEAGWEFDFAKKELKEIENEIEIPFGAKDSELQEVTYYIPKGFHAEINDDKVVIKKGEKPTAWSEEDELSCFESALFTAFSDAWQQYLRGKEVDIAQWAKEHSKELLEAAKEELKGHNSAWSEEDDDDAWLNDIISKAECNLQLNKGEIDWLKSLKDRYAWKPSSIQMECLYDAIHHYQTNGYPASKLNELYEQMSNIYKL